GTALRSERHRRGILDRGIGGVKRRLEAGRQLERRKALLRRRAAGGDLLPGAWKKSAGSQSNDRDKVQISGHALILTAFRRLRKKQAPRSPNIVDFEQILQQPNGGPMCVCLVGQHSICIAYREYGQAGRDVVVANRNLKRVWTV